MYKRQVPWLQHYAEYVLLKWNTCPREDLATHDCPLPGAYLPVMMTAPSRRLTGSEGAKTWISQVLLPTHCKNSLTSTSTSTSQDTHQYQHRRTSRRITAIHWHPSTIHWHTRCKHLHEAPSHAHHHHIPNNSPFHITTSKLQPCSSTTTRNAGVFITTRNVL